MKGINKFIWLAIVLAAIASVIPFLRDIYLASTYGATGVPYSVKEQWESVSVILLVLQNIASALWLRYLASNDKNSVLTWSVFGLSFGLISVAIYYMVRMNERIET